MSQKTKGLAALGFLILLGIFQFLRFPQIPETPEIIDADLQVSRSAVEAWIAEGRTIHWVSPSARPNRDQDRSIIPLPLDRLDESIGELLVLWEPADIVIVVTPETEARQARDLVLTLRSLYGMNQTFVLPGGNSPVAP
jgi:hypothetical protein